MSRQFLKKEPYSSENNAFFFFPGRVIFILNPSEIMTETRGKMYLKRPIHGKMSIFTPLTPPWLILTYVRYIEYIGGQGGTKDLTINK
jgi:hypothetical protein